MENASPTFFADAVRDAFNDLGGKGRLGALQELADRLEQHPTTVGQWLDGRTPKQAVMAKSLHKLGWRLERARPDFRPPVTVKPSIKILGMVRAGVIDFLEDPDAHEKKERRLNVDPAVFEESSRWGMTEGDVFGLQVYGNSMSGHYPHGSYIGVRKPRPKKEIPLGTPCVFETREGYTFKKLGKSADGRLMGYPLNIEEFQAVIFDREKADIAYVVLGKIDLDQEEAMPVKMARKAA